MDDFDEVDGIVFDNDSEHEDQEQVASDAPGSASDSDDLANRSPAKKAKPLGVRRAGAGRKKGSTNTK